MFSVVRRMTMNYNVTGGTWWCSWLRHCATSWTVAGSIANGIIGILHWHNPSVCTMVLRSIHPLAKISTRNISWGGEGSQCIGLTVLPTSCTECHEIWEPQPPGAFRVVQPCTGSALHYFCVFLSEFSHSVLRIAVIITEIIIFKTLSLIILLNYCMGHFHWHNPSDRTMALGSTQPLTEMSTRSISWG
jgi:hypothetical protein